MSLDALRGFDMFWIIGADSLVYALSRMSENPVTKFLASQLDHAEWAGFRFYDLIFPLFVFMVGASIVFSLTKIINRIRTGGAMGRVLKRGLLLFVIGIIYSGGFTNPWPDMRLMGVLNRIALAYTAAGLLFCLFKPRTLVAICGGILLGYWAMLAFIPIRDIQLDKTNLAALAERAGDAKTAQLFREAGNASAVNPSAIKASPTWAAAEQMYAATTNRVTGKYDPGYNVVNHFDFEHLPRASMICSSTRRES
jgi:predicted acyltransferase